MMPPENQNNLPKGFTCKCGRTHEFGGYVYAHWRERLVHSCTPGCGARHNIYMGKATLKKKDRNDI